MIGCRIFIADEYHSKLSKENEKLELKMKIEMLMNKLTERKKYDIKYDENKILQFAQVRKCLQFVAFPIERSHLADSHFRDTGQNVK